METKNILLTIEGEPGQEFQIWWRGDQDSDLEDPAPIIHTGILDMDGRTTIEVPRAYLMLGAPVRQNGIPLKLYQETGSNKTVRLQ